MQTFTQQDNIKKLIKYILIGLIVIGATRYIPDISLPTKEILMIGATASIAFGVIDMVYPSTKMNRKCSK
jgi:hypothetical protein